MRSLDECVSEAARNLYRGYPMINLHGDTVQVALERVEDFYLECKYENKRRFFVNAGQGHHSFDGFPHLRKAVMDLARRNGWRHYIDQDNKGMIAVHI